MTVSAPPRRKSPEGFKKALAIHAKLTSPVERRLYDEILGVGGTPDSKSAYVKLTMKLEETYFRLRKWLTRGRAKRALTAGCLELLEAT